MEQLKPGIFYGQTNHTINLDDIILTGTEYTLDFVDWHYHENAYFTFILEGNVNEHSKQHTHSCSAGTLLFHNCEEPHYNTKSKGFTRGFHVELNRNWFNSLDIDISTLNGNLNISHPHIKLLFYNIFKETKINDGATLVTIQQLLIQGFTQMLNTDKTIERKNPLWVNKVKEILHDDYSQKLTLENLSASLNIHPVHLSRDFVKYFNCTLGTYVRKIRIEKSLSFLYNRNLSLTDIAFSCGFFDQSHFLRCFKQANGITPSAYRKILCRN